MSLRAIAKQSKILNDDNTGKILDRRGGLLAMTHYYHNDVFFSFGLRIRDFVFSFHAEKSTF
jgi:hypothetical protein